MYCSNLHFNTPKVKLRMKSAYLITGLLILLFIPLFSQIDPYNIDTTSTFYKDFDLLRNKFQNLNMSGYIQAQFQVAQTKGIESFNGGDFILDANNRFMIRRGRMRIDYTISNKEGFRKAYFAFQFDATERGVFMRDMFLRIFENNKNNFILTSGMFHRPFGYELQMASALRESPERGRMSQILMRTERDIGCMVSFKPQNKKNTLYHMNLDLGVFNGPGLTALVDYDKYKDVIARISFNEMNFLHPELLFWGGVSYLNGGIASKNRNVFSSTTLNGTSYMLPDTSLSNLDKRLPRTYYGFDARWRFQIQNSYLEFRSELIFGRQTSLKNNSATPVSQPNEPTYIRNFNGAYFYLIGNIKNKHVLLIKYDWYDPNTEIAGSRINEQFGYSRADIRYNTLGFGYTYFFNPQTKLLLYYDIPRNESVNITGFTRDIKDNTFTVRTQLLF